MNLIAHVEIPVLDLDRAIGFYSSVFGIAFGRTVQVHDSTMAYFPFEPGQGGASGALAQGPEYAPATTGAVVYFSVDDVGATLDKAVALGSTVLFLASAVTQQGMIAEISDSEGNRIALQSR